MSDNTESSTAQNAGAEASHHNNGFTRADTRVGFSAKVLIDLAKAGLTPVDIATRDETFSSLLHKFGRRTAERVHRAPAYAILYPGSKYERTKFLDDCPEDPDIASIAGSEAGPPQEETTSAEIHGIARLEPAARILPGRY
jgi:hypothetical protein